jgi:predicted nucleotidyltransferase
LKELFRSLEDVYKEIAYEVTNFIALLPIMPEVKTIILFGSLASSKVRESFVKEPSDVDLIIVFQNVKQVIPLKNGALDFVNSKIFPVYGVNVYPVVLSVDGVHIGFICGFFHYEYAFERRSFVWRKTKTIRLTF